MGALARLSDAVVDVEPGGTISLELTVRNTGTVVDQFTFEILGAAGAWTTVEPPTVSLFPQGEEAVQVVFAPPRLPSTLAGPVPFAVRVVSQEDPPGSVVEEGTVHVTPFSEVLAELTPRATRVRRRGHVQILVDNRSNIPYQAGLVGADPDGAFDYLFQPALVDVEAGTVSFTRLTVRAKRRYWRGPSTTEPFQVLLRQQQVPEEAAAETWVGPHPPEILADGAVLRDPLLPRWLPKAVLGVLALAALLAVLWFTLVKPQITAAAQNQVKKDIKPIAAKQAAQTKAIKKLQSEVPTTTSSGPAPGTTTTTTTTVPRHTTTTVKTKRTTTTTLPPVVKTPVNDSITANGNNTTAAFSVPSGQTLEVTDILLENSSGASGNIYLARNGVVLMSWALANFRDLDYHWITPIYFNSGTQLQLIVRGCTGVCKPGLYFAGDLTTSR